MGVVFSNELAANDPRLRSLDRLVKPRPVLAELVQHAPRSPQRDPRQYNLSSGTSMYYIALGLAGYTNHGTPSMRQEDLRRLLDVNGVQMRDGPLLVHSYPTGDINNAGAILRKSGNLYFFAMPDFRGEYLVLGATQGWPEGARGWYVEGWKLVSTNMLPSQRVALEREEAQRRRDTFGAS